MSTFSDKDSAIFKMASALAFAFARIAFASPKEKDYSLQCSETGQYCNAVIIHYNAVMSIFSY